VVENAPTIQKNQNKHPLVKRVLKRLRETQQPSYAFQAEAVDIRIAHPHHYAGAVYRRHSVGFSFSEVSNSGFHLVKAKKQYSNISQIDH